MKCPFLLHIYNIYIYNIYIAGVLENYLSIFLLITLLKTFINFIFLILIFTLHGIGVCVCKYFFSLFTVFISLSKIHKHLVSQ